MRIVFWNIWHGGGSRAGAIVEQILEWSPDIVALAEFRGTTPSQSIAKGLYDAGYIHQLSTVIDDRPARNALFVASRFGISKICLEGAPQPNFLWTLVKAHTVSSIHVGVIHVPLDADLPGAWHKYFMALLRIARDWRLGPGLFLGDMNSGLSSLDEETEYSHNYKATFINPMQATGWRDMFRVLHSNEDAPTWFSRNNRGFRLDQAFVNPDLQPRVSSCQHDWGSLWNDKKLSDHAAILLDLELPG